MGVLVLFHRYWNEGLTPYQSEWLFYCKIIYFHVAQISLCYEKWDICWHMNSCICSLFEILHFLYTNRINISLNIWICGHILVPTKSTKIKPQWILMISQYSSLPLYKRLNSTKPKYNTVHCVYVGVTGVKTLSINDKHFSKIRYYIYFHE